MTLTQKGDFWYELQSKSGNPRATILQSVMCILFFSRLRRRLCQGSFCNGTIVFVSLIYRRAKYVGYQRSIFIEKSCHCIIVTAQMYMKLAVGGVVLVVMGILLTLPGFEINSVVQVRIVPPLLVGIFSGTFGLVAAMIGFCTPLWDYLFPSET